MQQSCTASTRSVLQLFFLSPYRIWAKCHKLKNLPKFEYLAPLLFNHLPRFVLQNCFCIEHYYVSCEKSLKPVVTTSNMWHHRVQSTVNSELQAQIYPLCITVPDLLGLKIPVILSDFSSAFVTLELLWASHLRGFISVPSLIGVP